MFLKIPRHYGEAPTYAACFEPTTIILAVSAVVSAAAAAKAGADQAAAAKFQQAVALQNSQRAVDIAALNADEKRREGSQLAAEQRARLAASGVDISSGTSLLLQQDLAAETEFQALLIQAGGDTQAAGFTSDATVFGMDASSAITQGNLGAGTTLLRGASKVFKK